MTSWLEKWKSVEKPTKIKEFRNPDTVGMVKYCSLGILCAIITLWFLDYCYKIGRSLLSAGFENILVGNAVLYCISLLTMLIPLIIGGLISTKTSTPIYGYLIPTGFIISGIFFFQFLQTQIALYAVFTNVLLLAIVLRSPGDYVLKLSHLGYFLILGAITCYLNIWITYFFGEIWCYLQFVHLHLLAIILIALRIRQWGYSYMIGWGICAFVFLFIPDQMVNGIYSLITPIILTGAVLHYYYKIWRPTGKKLNTPQV